MFDIITFGSATQDIIITPKKLTVLKYEKTPDNNQNVCFPVGSKLELEDIKFLGGGGGANAAVTFAKQGFKTAFCGAIGDDKAGKEVIDSLKKMTVNVALVVKKNERPTNQSVVISGEGQDRTIFAHRGAAELMSKDEIPWKKLKAKWLYLAPLGGAMAETFEDLVSFAKEQNIKVVANPGIAQLSLSNFPEIAKKLDVLFLNQEEASFLTKISIEKESEIFARLYQMCKGVAVMTKGGQGVLASDGKYIYSAVPNPNRKVVDTTGAGDSFASGFLVDYINYQGDIEKGIQMGLANSEANLSEIGAQTGLLKKGTEITRVFVKKEPCLTQ